MDEIERLRVRVSGRVQGVGYRAYARRQARGLDLSGWVRNERDGSVLVEAEGPREKLERLLLDLRAGPSAGRVERAEPEWKQATGAYNGFVVRF